VKPELSFRCRLDTVRSGGEADSQSSRKSHLRGISQWTGLTTATQLEQARATRSLDAWHDDGMNRIRLSTTVDASLLEHARSVRSGTTDAALIDEALAALLARYRAAEVDASYAAYDEHPLEEPDEWGDLASFRRAVASS
jgi:hypothetical protein